MSRDAYDSIYRHSRPRNDQRENGGILIGQTNGKDVLITDVSVPGFGDKRLPFKFIRSRRRANRIVSAFFWKSGRKKIYLGEWHTHAEHLPKPSLEDRKMIAAQLRVNDLNEPFVLLVISGYKAIYVGLCDDLGLDGCTVDFDTR